MTSQSKKNLLIITCIFLSFLFNGCKKKEKTSPSTPYTNNYNYNYDYSSNDNYVEIRGEPFVSSDLFFKPDYTPEESEPLSEPKKVDLSSTPVTNQETTSFIPGLRKLDDYKTDYFQEKLNLSDYIEKIRRENPASTGIEEGKSLVSKPGDKTESSDEKKSTSKDKKKSSDEKENKSSQKTLEEKAAETEKGDLIIKYWGPSNECPGEMSNPEFYIEFSLPVKTLAALDDQEKIDEECKQLMNITPEIKGHYHWTGTKMLRFDAEDSLDPQQAYTITVDKNIKSIGGKPLTGNTEFTTITGPVRLIRVTPGCLIDGTIYSYNGSSYGMVKEHAVFSKITFNAYLTEDEVKNYLSINYSNGSNKFKYTPTMDPNNQIISSEGIQKNKTFYIVINEALENERVIEYTCVDSKKNKTTTDKYSTLVKFKLTDTERYDDHYYYGTGYKFTFNQNVDYKSAINAVEIKGSDYSSSNIHVDGNNVIVRNLKLSPGATTTLMLHKNIKNIEGYELGREFSDSFVKADYRGEANFIDSGFAIMESQFPHRLVFQYMNQEGKSAYKVTESDDPFWYPNNSWENEYNDGIALKYKERNKRFYEDIDLNPYLNSSGKGWINFFAYLDLYSNPNSNHYYPNIAHNFMSIQVTDLAASVRYGRNKAVAMVRSMEHNTPIEGASVSIYNSETGYCSQEVLTDKNGLAVINLQDYIFKDYSSYAALKVEYGDDKVTFHPTTHSTWVNGVSSQSMEYAYDVTPRIYMFCDRGLYKPGETITFKGIDRDQQFGYFKPYEGRCTVSLVQRNWNNNKVYKNLKLKTTSSGGFHGSFDLPDDLEPGTYAIEYTRGSSDNCMQSLYFTVAFFEPLKIQSNVSFKKDTYYNGDELQADLKAMYLAGGFLSNCDYKGTWYNQSSSFSVNEGKYKNYVFGPQNAYDSKDYVNSESGKLTENGSASLSCVAHNSIKGAPYIYHIEASVTDESNQRITNTQSIVVHPASCYIGIGRPLNTIGFAKAGQSIDVPYALFTPDKNKLTDLSLTDGEISYNLKREYWTYAYQSSVYGGVYGRYSKHSEYEIDKRTVDLEKEGTINITPQASGIYTLSVYGYDSKKRYYSTDYTFYCTGSDSICFSSINSSMLNLTPDQSLYNPGDTAQVLLESPLPKGDYLITVEREGIFTEEIKHFDQPCSVIDVPIARNYVPVVYVSVSSYSVRHEEPSYEYGEKDMDKPKGYYGVTRLFVDQRVKAFSIDVTTDKNIYKPGDTATVTLSATKGGNPVEGAELTCMAADRAVLDLINYHVDDPISFYYNINNFPLRVKGGDSRDYLMDPVIYSIKNLQGGDSSSKEEEDGVRKNFKPTAFFEPTLITDKDGKVSFTFTVPDNLTTFRVTAFGVKDELLALQESEFVTQNPINVQAVQPRRLRVRDTAECGVVITNLDTEAHDVTISVDIRDPKGNYDEDISSGKLTAVGKAFIDGENTHTVKVGGGRTSVVYFDVAASEKGNIELLYTVQSEMFSEKLVSKLLIEQTYVKETVALTGSTSYVSKGEESAVEGIVIPGFAKEGVGDIKVTLDATRLGMLGSSVDYLFHYPYGCMEQQSSCILPLITFAEYIDVFGLDSEVSDPKKVCKTYFKKWKNVQLYDGGFPYWPDGSESNYYVSLRILHIAAIAKQKGYNDSDIAININSLKKYILNKAKQTEYYDSNDAYACYIFALLGDNSLDSLLSSLDSKAYDNLDVAAYCGLAYALSNNSANREKAKKYANLIRSYMRPSLRTVDITQPTRTDWNRYWYSNNISQMALILQLFTTVDPEDEMVDRLINTLLTKQSFRGYWSNTITSAKVLEAINAVIKTRKLDTTNYSAKATLEGIELLSANFKGAGSKPVDKKIEFADSSISGLKKDKELCLEFNVKGTGTLYYNTELTYALPDEVLKPREEGFNVTYEIIDTETNQVVSPDAKNLRISLKTGKVYKARVTVKTTKDRNFVAVRIPIPSGAEILDSQFATTGSDATVSNSSSRWYNSSAIYDNEMNFFVNDYDKGTKTFEFNFRTMRRGVYPTTPAQVECMYTPEDFGRSDGYLITIE